MLPMPPTVLVLAVPPSEPVTEGQKHRLGQIAMRLAAVGCVPLVTTNQDECFTAMAAFPRLPMLLVNLVWDGLHHFQMLHRPFVSGVDIDTLGIIEGLCTQT